MLPAHLKDNLICFKIVHVLSMYPVLSPSMLQIGLGTALPPDLWKPLVEELITLGVVKRDDVVSMTPTNRLQTYTRLSLANEAAENLKALSMQFQINNAAHLIEARERDDESEDSPEGPRKKGKEKKELPRRDSSGVELPPDTVGPKLRRHHRTTS